jgi:hypothetical protein
MEKELLEILIGIPKEDAFKLCKENNVIYRVTKEDSTNYIVTMDLRSDRISLEINNGIISNCYLG